MAALGLTAAARVPVDAPALARLGQVQFVEAVKRRYSRTAGGKKYGRLAEAAWRALVGLFVPPREGAQAGCGGGDSLEGVEAESGGRFYPVKVIAVDQAKGRIQIHYVGWKSRHDEWLPVRSERLRGLAAEEVVAPAPEDLPGVGLLEFVFFHVAVLRYEPDRDRAVREIVRLRLRTCINMYDRDQDGLLEPAEVRQLAVDMAVGREHVAHLTGAVAHSAGWSQQRGSAEGLYRAVRAGVFARLSLSTRDLSILRVERQPPDLVLAGGGGGSAAAAVDEAEFMLLGLEDEPLPPVGQAACITDTGGLTLLITTEISKVAVTRRRCCHSESWRVHDFVDP